MPTYGYQCTACDNQFEIVQRITDDPLTTCESCGGTLRKKIFPVGIAFKGTGFYVNDYAAKPASTAASPAADSATTTDSAKPAETTAKTETTATPAASTPTSLSSSETIKSATSSST